MKIIPLIKTANSRHISRCGKGMEKMGEIYQKMYDTLTGMQSGRIPAPEGWIVEIA